MKLSTANLNLLATIVGDFTFEMVMRLVATVKDASDAEAKQDFLLLVASAIHDSKDKFYPDYDEQLPYHPKPTFEDLHTLAETYAAGPKKN